jgi:hypothetical protein
LKYIMKDIIDRYEESKFPALLEVLFFMILIMDLLLAIWMTFIAPLHIEKMPYLKIFYLIVIPIAYIFPLMDAICIKKSKKYLLQINDIYLLLRIVYLVFTFINETKYRIIEASSNLDNATSSSIISSGIFNISFTLVFSIVWIIAINKSKKVKYHINN